MKAPRAVAALVVITISLSFIIQSSSGFLFSFPANTLSNAATGTNRKTSTPPELRAYDMLVTMPDGGEQRIVSANEGQSILEALEMDGIEAPHSCRSGLCTECAAMVTANLDKVKLEAAVLEPEVSARGFVLTCSSTIAGSGVELELGAGDKMYEAQYGGFRKDHEEAQTSKPGKWSIPFPDISGA